jgi:hypothetical protein
MTIELGIPLLIETGGCHPLSLLHPPVSYRRTCWIYFRREFAANISLTNSEGTILL